MKGVTHPTHISATAMIMCEQAIRDQAAKVLAHVQMRAEHPSYGYTKTGIRAEMHKLDGMAGLYSMLVGQANHAGAGALADFAETETGERVKAARLAVKEM